MANENTVSAEVNGAEPFAEARGSGASACGHRTAYYNAEHDNFYCRACNKGMGQDYYNLNIGRVTAQPPNVCVSDGPADAPELTRSAEGPFAARNG